MKFNKPGFTQTCTDYKSLNQSLQRYLQRECIQSSDVVFRASDEAISDVLCLKLHSDKYFRGRETTGVSPNPKEVLNEEMYEHMGEQAATTFANTEEDSGNINKTSSMETLNEQSFKGPWCQEPTGVESASVRQKAPTTKRSHDPSKGGNTPGEGEDRYDYQELMDTMGNINLDVIKQGADLEEMIKLQGNETARVEMEKRMKESNDFLIQKPFPDEQETPKKEATLGESLRTLKRTKMVVRGKLTKKPRISEGEDEKAAEEEGAPDSSKQKEPSSTDDVKMYMVVMDKVPEPISAEPVGVKPPEVILWDTLTVDGKEYIRLKRKNEKYEVFNTWAKIVRTCSRSDIEEMFEIGIKLYADKLKAQGISIAKLVSAASQRLILLEEVTTAKQDNEDCAWKEDSWIEDNHGRLEDNYRRLF
ncbi:hypothetical protein L6452_42347 [Arctium lappa]|uniref:Uncharacterized protein n=1 Tax=Arctium lappa TaxID=4217 RepID=A0ACB8XHJ0_ARCLA|nr:hypothetical protein L6452_42347 [Arctium lappa]